MAVVMSGQPKRRDDLVQQTPEWHEWRDRHINGSDAPTIMLADPFRDPFRLWLEKTGRAPRPEFHDYWEGGELVEHPVHHGTRLEDVARDWYCRENGLFTAPVCLEHGSIEWMGCSLDGWPHPGVVLEIKCPRELRTHLNAIEGGVEESHWIQCQHNMAVAAVEKCDLLSYFRTNESATPSVCVNSIAYDREFVENELLPAEREFRKWVEEDHYPLPEGNVDVEPTDEEWRRVVAHYLDARRIREQAEADEAAALRNLKLRTRGAARTRDGIIECKWFVRRGAVMWQQIPAVQELVAQLGPRLDDYRRPSMLAFRVNRVSIAGPLGEQVHGDQKLLRDHHGAAGRGE